MTVGQLIKKHRLLAGFSQARLAGRAGLTQKIISQFERDEIESRDALARIAEVLDAPIILMTAVRSSMLMRRALEMLGYDAEKTKISTIIDVAQQELTAIQNTISDNPQEAHQHAERLSDLANALQILIPIMSKTG